MTSKVVLYKAWLTHRVGMGAGRCRLKLAEAAEKAKKTLSPAGVTEAAVNIECLMDELDLNVKVTIEDFESRAQPLLARLEGPIRQALAGAWAAWLVAGRGLQDAGSGACKACCAGRQGRDNKAKRWGGADADVWCVRQRRA
jgi:hypothetical protein